ncbi:MAG: hypothetical protein ACQGVC_05795 [Myxococcota bacterium]
MFIHELDDAKEHLDELIQKLVASGRYEEPELSVELGHVFAHLNRAWRMRDLANQPEEPSSSFPTDLEPVG